MLKTLFFLLIVSSNLLAHDILELEKNLSPFVVSTKKITIDGFRYSFNPSIVRFRNSYLMSFRISDKMVTKGNKLALILLDQEFNPIGKPQTLDLYINENKEDLKTQDARLLYIGEKLYIVFNSSAKGRMLFAELVYKEGKFIPSPPVCLVRFEGEKSDQIEKNWVPFDYDNQLLLAYSINPHRIFKPIPGTKSCETFAQSTSNLDWEWGEIRGGTPALKIGNEYLAFFHSSKRVISKNLSSKIIRHYFIGAYTFTSKPPFSITRFSPSPIVGEKFYTGPIYETWIPMRVVFPCGYILDEKFIWLAYGRQDHEIWIAKIDKQGLLKSLKKV